MNGERFRLETLESNVTFIENQESHSILGSRESTIDASENPNN